VRLAVCVFVACGSLLSAGCASKPASPAPIVSGQLVSVTLWEKPVQRAGETGSNSGNPVKEGRVDVYDQFIIVTLPNGTRLLSLHGWYTGLTSK
jgi:hypothetical protein